MNRWKMIKVGELGKIVTGKTPKTSIKENYGGDIPFITPSDNMLVKFIKTTNKKLTMTGLKEVENYILPPNTVCVSCIGSNLGKVVITTEKSISNQQINSIILKESLYSKDFVYYAMLILGKELNYISKTSTAVPIVNKTNFSNYEIAVPILVTQKQIEKILSSIDAKIELNNQINDNLEQQAQAIFDDMFVLTKNDARCLGKLSDLITVKYGKDHKKLNDGIYPVYGSGGIMRYVERFLYDRETVLIPRKGTLNNVIYLNEPFWSVDTMFYTEMKHDNIAKFIFHFVKSKDLASMNAGSAVPSMTTDILNTMELNIPTKVEFEQFNSSVSAMYLKIQMNTRENVKLAQLRDTLLPRLMRGEIDVSQVEV